MGVNSSPGAAVAMRFVPGMTVLVGKVLTKLLASDGLVVVDVPVPVVAPVPVVPVFVPVPIVVPYSS